MASERFLVVAETFYSIQGEGKTCGVPAVFLRLAGCNLRCNGFTYQDPETKQHLGCDSKQVWLKGVKHNFSEIIEHWQQQGWLDALNRGAHLIVTGGEPLLQQQALIKFLEVLDATLENKLFIEIETNATIKMMSQLFDRINQFNVSPKLTHSGETRAKAYHSEILTHFVSSSKSVFKFVIATPADVDEVLADYVKPLSIDCRTVWLMPEGGTVASIESKKLWLVELCKRYSFNFTSRMQLDLWGEVVGV